MSTKKRPTQRERLENAAWGLHPRSGADMVFRGMNGGFSFRSPLEVWFWLTAFPSVCMGAFWAASVVGFTAWPPALFIAALFGFLGMLTVFLGLRAIVTRGWGEAIMSIEHKKRKQEHYDG